MSLKLIKMIVFFSNKIPYNYTFQIITHIMELTILDKNLENITVFENIFIIL